MAPTQAADTIRALDGAIRRLLQAERIRMAQLLAEHGLSFSTFMVMVCLSHHGGECPIGRLADELDQANATMTGTVDRLESRHLVSRSYGNKQDRRMVTVQLTAKGRALIERLEQARLAQLQQQLGHLPEQDVRTFVSFVEGYLNTTLAHHQKSSPFD